MLLLVLIAAGAAAPTQLALRADVVSRLAWGLVYEVHALTDAEKAGALAERARARGFTLHADVSQYLLTHARRRGTTRRARPRTDGGPPIERRSR